MKTKKSALRILTAEQAAKAIDSKAKRSGGGWSCRCPAHEDATPSLSITDMAGGGLKVKCFSGCSQDAVISAIEDGHGIAVCNREPVKPDSTGNINALQRRGWRIVASYPYRDENGVELYQNVRLETEQHGERHKTFRQQRRTPAGGFTPSLDGVERVPYNLPDLVRRIGEDIHVAEGEKDSESLGRVGLLSTSIASDAAVRLNVFQGRHVFLHEDNDRPGRVKVLKLGMALMPIAASVRVVRYHDAGDGGDVTDWLNQDHDSTDLLERCEEAPAFNPADYVDLETKSKKEATPKPDKLTEIAVARMFEETENGHRLYECNRERWFICDDAAIWREDLKGRTRRAMQDHCASLGDPSYESAKRVSAIHDLAKVAPCFAVTSEEFDPDPNIAGCPAGHIDLTTGKILKGDPSRRITMSTAVTPQVMPTPIWHKFLNEATGNDPDMIRFLRQFFGYSLSGDTREQCLVFMYGPGGSGKGTLLGTISDCFGSYGWTAPIDAFTNGLNGHPTTYASMVGRRLVTASETEQGRKWAEAKIKHITGQDRINARFMRKDEFQFTPAFKLVISGNHPPVIQNPDEAMRRRIHVVPFDRRFDAATADKQLKDKLKAEWPGILQWCIEGGLDWRQNGLVVPKCIRDATSSFFDEQDVFSQWVEQDVTFGERHTATATELFRSWSKFAQESGEEIGSQKALAAKLKKLPGVRVSLTVQRPKDPLTGKTGKPCRTYTGLQVAAPETPVTDRYGS